MYAKLNQLTLPTSAQLSDGRWVSNYDKLPVDTLLKEDWLPLEEVKPLLADGQYYELESVIESDGHIVATYRVVTPEPPIDPEPILTELEGLL